MPLKLVESGCLSRPRSRCGAVRIFGHGGHFSWQAQGKPRLLVVQSRLFVTGAEGSERFYLEMQISWQVQHGQRSDFVTDAVSESESERVRE